MAGDIRLGVIVPNVNTVVEEWYPKVVPERVSVYFARMLIADGTSLPRHRRRPPVQAHYRSAEPPRLPRRRPRHSDREGARAVVFSAICGGIALGR
jgi:hypothetical protein